MLDFVTIFSQNLSVSGWFAGLNGEWRLTSEPIDRSRFFSESASAGCFSSGKLGTPSDDNSDEDSFKICLHFLDLRVLLAQKRRSIRVVRYLGEWL